MVGGGEVCAVFLSAASCYSKMQIVEIPGYAEAMRLEQASRLSAFDESQQNICGIVVEPLTLRKCSLLRREMNGYFVPCQFESEVEAHAHARQIAWFCAPEFFYPTTKLEAIRYTWRQARWISQVNKIRPSIFTREVLRFVEESFYDSPFHGDTGSAEDDTKTISSPSVAVDIVYVADMFARAGYPYSLRDILDMPLKQLWQFTRVIHKREGTNLSNRSTAIATRHLHEMQKGKK